ncbi:phosphomevalonate kinase [Streptomyces sp. NPDC006285]|uniref:phosphomevalonate kinase n=1 Tax=Streptomyces sp. NPDC006285 TaxID=3364742 RepID=UPI0036BF10CC
MAARTTRRAPGKLMVAGEYAVLEPGRPAVVVAVDRYVTVTVTAAEDADVVIGSDLLDHELRLRRGGQGLEALSGQDPALVRGVLAHVVSAVETIEELRTERRLGLAPVRLSIRSDLHRGGVKTGLGSSAAVTVATLRALADHYGMRLSAEDRFRLALLATVRVDPGPSGADLAAATWRGWVSYRSPDRRGLLNDLHRHGVAHTLERPWTECAVRPLPPPTGLALHVGWSGSAASTTALVADLATRPGWQGVPRARFLDDSEQCVSVVERALRGDEPSALLDAVRTARGLLARLDEETSLGIVTEPLRRLCEVAESCGAAAKPSGAGGGDCGIALLPAHRSPALLRLRWTAAGITPLPLEATSGATAGPSSGPGSGREDPPLSDVSPSLRGHTR